MDLDSKRLVVVVPNEVSVASRRVFSSEDEAWKSYLENPLTAATKAMMSINGDEDSAAALGLLYDYYKVPKERRSNFSGKSTDPTTVSSISYSDLDLADPHRQPVRSMPVNLSLNSSNNAEHKNSKHGAVSLSGDTAGGDGKGGGSTPLVLVKAESPTSMPVPCSAGSYHEEPRQRMSHEQSCYSLTLSGYPKDDQSSTPDSTYDGEIYQRAPSPDVDGLPRSLPCDTFRYSLDASMSLRPRQGEGPMAYLNRGQFYALTLSECGFRSSLCQSGGKVRASGAAASRRPGGTSEQCGVGGSELQHDSIVQSVIMVVFGEDKCRDEQLKNWKYWHSRQHTAKQRVLEIGAP